MSLEGDWIMELLYLSVDQSNEEFKAHQKWVLVGWDGLLGCDMEGAFLSQKLHSLLPDCYGLRSFPLPSPSTMLFLIWS